MIVTVFKTNVADSEDVGLLSPALNRLSDCSKWNFDLDDCDNVLRVESEIDMTSKIIETLVQTGFRCQELE